MFAPPPVQLSKAEVERRLAAKNRNSSSRDSIGRATSTSSGSSLPSSLHRNDLATQKSPSKFRTIFSKADKPRVSAPIVPAPPVDTPKQKPVGVFEGAFQNSGPPKRLPATFAERPRQAPEPPRRPSRPSDSPLLSSVPGAFAISPEVPPSNGSPPPVPERSPRRQDAAHRYVGSQQGPERQSFDNDRSSSTGKRKPTMNDGQVWPAHTSIQLPLRSFAAPPADTRMDSVLASTAQQSRTKGGKGASVLSGISSTGASGLRTSPRLSGVKGARVDKGSPTSKRLSAASAIRAALLELEELRALEEPQRRATEGQVDFSSSTTRPTSQLPAKQRKKGEAIDQLLERGFFLKQSPASSADEFNVNVRLTLSPPLSLLDKELPATPTSIIATPTEMYSSVPTRPTRTAVRNSKRGAKKRNPLAPISITNSKANSTTLSEEPDEMSPTGLSAIPEYSPTSENSEAASGAATPTATHIHLRGGSILTVSPPEMTAWQRAFYVQGPIKLPKPVLVPVKDSVASLEPFQEVIDQVYQDALVIPRRRSDDAIVEDMCEFFDDFGFDEVSYEGDTFSVDEMDDMEELNSDLVPDAERFSTPPVQPDPAPIEKIVAAEVAQMMAKPPPVPLPPIPPVKEQLASAREGLGKFSQNRNHQPLSIQAGRKDSLTLSRSTPEVVPLPREGMSNMESPESGLEQKGLSVGQGQGASNDIADMGSSTSWWHPLRVRSNKP